MESINNINADLATFTSLVPAREERSNRPTLVALPLPEYTSPIWAKGHNAVTSLMEELDAIARKA